MYDNGAHGYSSEVGRSCRLATVCPVSCILLLCPGSSCVCASSRCGPWDPQEPWETAGSSLSWEGSPPRAQHSWVWRPASHLSPLTPCVSQDGFRVGLSPTRCLGPLGGFSHPLLTSYPVLLLISLTSDPAELLCGPKYTPHPDHAVSAPPDQWFASL